MKFIGPRKLRNGERVWFAENRWIFFEDDDGNLDETTGQEIAMDTLDYRYTHGSSLYREACVTFNFGVE